MKSLVIATAILFLAAGAGAVKCYRVRTDLAGQQRTIEADWSDTAGEIKARLELIPRLAGFLSAAESTGSGADRSIVDARSPQEQIAANEKASMEIGKLLLTAENHPRLRHDPQFQHLQDELARVEDRINNKRRKYNEAIEHYNVAIQEFPNNIVARISGFSRNDAYFKTEPGAKDAPKVQF